MAELTTKKRKAPPDIDDKLSQKVFRDYARGLRVQDIVERHGITPGALRKIVKFESAVKARVDKHITKLTIPAGPKPTLTVAKRGPVKRKGR
jgi:hypothetical protein